MSKEITQFRRKVWTYWRTHGRHDLPWRKTRDPYKILVSEMMLQQTQVPRVLEKYAEFLEEFPTVFVLAHASLRDVLRVWSGLGYNRRGKFLHDAAKMIANEFQGSIRDAMRAKRIPGLGPYTKDAVAVFAFNDSHVLLETNVRAAIIHHFHTNVLQNDGMTDAAVMEIAVLAAADQDPREWHWALMDYGVHIKKKHKNPARRSASYAEQSKFEGSPRQLRGAILRTLNASAKTESDIYLKTSGTKYIKKAQLKAALASLKRDGLVRFHAGKWCIA
jgi:A/G-specific adenine glycosylase